MLEKIYALLESIGMTPEELVLKWIENGKIDLDRIAELVRKNAQEKSFELKKVKEVEPGMFLTADKKVCRQFDAERSAAIVLKVYDDNRTALAVDINGVSLAFSRDGLETDTLGFSGLNATHYISQMALDQNVTAEAADYCIEFENSFIRKSTAFLPSKEELESLDAVAEKIYPAFVAAKMADKTLWTSTTPARSLKEEETCKTEYIFSLRSSKVSIHSEYVSLPLSVHPFYKVDLRDFM